MFRLRRIDQKNYPDVYIGGSVYEINYNQEPFCLLSSWTLGSCAARSLFQFSSRDGWNNEEFVGQFFDWLDENDYNFYNSKNIYLFLSAYQVTNSLSILVQDSRMKEIDQFRNRGNGGSAEMTLFRWTSLREDDEEEDEEAEDW